VIFIVLSRKFWRKINFLHNLLFINEKCLTIASKTIIMYIVILGVNVMICDVSSILKVKGAKISIDESIPSIAEDEKKEPVLFDIEVKGEIVNIGDVLELSAKAEGIFKTECARCLKPVDAKFSIDFTEVLKNVDEEISDKDAVVTFEGFTVDLFDIVRSNIFVNLSTKYLCSEDCKGICSVCGADLNESPCCCEKEYIDPRMEGLRKLLEKDQEV